MMDNRTGSDFLTSLWELPLPVVEFDMDGAITASNRHFEVLLGLQMLPGNLFSYLDESSASELRELIDAGVHTAELDLTVRTAAGMERYPFRVYRGPAREVVLLCLQQIESSTEVREQLSAAKAELDRTRRELDKNAARLSQALDEVERKFADNKNLAKHLRYRDDELKSQNEELFTMTQALHRGEEELLRIKQQMERRSRELQIALSGRTRFYANMSHELRTPVNAVLGYNDLLLAGVYGRLNEQQELAVERSQKAVRHLRELINDVLDLSTIEAGKLAVDPEPVSLTRLVDDVVEAVRALANAQAVDIHVSFEDCPEMIVSDPRRLRRILLTLLSNSIRNGGGKPVWLRCEQSSAGGIAIEVVDNGRGFTIEDLTAVFDEFGAGTEDQEGSGLGLSIARRLARLLGGELSASSTVGVGTTFRLTLPELKLPQDGGTGSH